MSLQEFKKEFVDYQMMEFEKTEEDAKRDLEEQINENPKSLGIAYTTLGDNEDLEIQVNINLEDYKLESYIYGQHVDEKEVYSYDNIGELVDLLQTCSFDDFVDFDSLDVFELLEEEQQKNKTGNGFEPTDSELERLNEVLVNYYCEEFGDSISEANFKIGNLRMNNIIPIAATETDNGNPIEVKLELDRMVLISEGESIQYFVFNTIEDMINYIERISFEAFTQLDERALDQII